jgi:ATP-dependent DNA helicase UvrD/PcrA
VITPTPAQARVRDHEALSLVLVAPAGCGKTEALAMRIAGLVERGTVAPPQRILATTFTNRAKDNMRSRLRDHLSYSAQRDRVTVANFHGLAARIIRAHGVVIGLDPLMEMPDGDWVRERGRELGLGSNAIDNVDGIFRETKQQALDDAAVAAALTARGNPHAIQIEQQTPGRKPSDL